MEDNPVENFLETEKKENLDIVVATKDEALWTKVINGYKEAIESMEEQLKVNKVFLAQAEKEREAAKEHVTA